MASGLNVAQGSLNRLKAAVIFTVDPSGNNLNALNILASNLGTEGIRLAFDDVATDLIPTMTGMVTSPRPYQGVTLTAAIVKSTSSHLANNFRRQFQLATLLGTITVYPDTPQIDPFILYNMTLETVREMAFAGTEAVMIITMRGYYPVNNNYFGDGYEAAVSAVSTSVNLGGQIPAGGP
jgi:hypothetical protein